MIEKIKNKIKELRQWNYDFEELNPQKSEVLWYTPLWVCAEGGREAWQSHSKSDSDIKNNITGEKDKEFIERIGNKFKHKSILRHLTYTFRIMNFSRATLQELSRHCVGIAPTVKSTRYTLKELAQEKEFIDDIQRASKYFVFSGDEVIDKYALQNLENTRKIVAHYKGKNLDRIKILLPEGYKTRGVYTINGQELQHLLELRSQKDVFWDFRILVYNLYLAIPDEHKYLYSVNLED